MYSTCRKSKSIKKNNPGWIVTFADMMALLLTFFIMLLSFSTMDTQKYKAVVESMEEAFGPGVGVDMQGLVSKMEYMTGGKKEDYKKHPNEVKPESEEKLDKEIKQDNKNVNKVIGKAKSILKEELKQGEVQIELIGSNIVIRFPERIVFPSGSDELNDSFDSIINKLTKILSDVPGLVTISGHTDNLPIDTFRFRSNWELSASRAVSVLHAILNNSDLDSNLFTVQGHADTQPIKPNTSAANRAENRRVEITIQGVDNKL